LLFEVFFFARILVIVVAERMLDLGVPIRSFKRLFFLLLSETLVLALKLLGVLALKPWGKILTGWRVIYVGYLGLGTSQLGFIHHFSSFRHHILR
jgi:hypothetical protein